MSVNLILMVTILAVLFLLLFSLLMFGLLIKHSLKKLAEKNSVVNTTNTTKIDKQDNKVLVLSEALANAENLRKVLDTKIVALKKDLLEVKND